ncbi:MAG: hypothetical protein MJ074_07465, partial [Oscillospiraceae bacterium]|nr:hypothetical protein [Oscillospiraceae bacterium]
DDDHDDDDPDSPGDFKATIDPIADKTYTGEPIEPDDEVIVRDGEKVIPAQEYTIAYRNNIEVGVADVIVTFKEDGNYRGTVATTFNILPKFHSDDDPTHDFTATVKPISDKTYTGEPIEPDDEVIVMDGTRVIDPDEYTIRYENNINVGTADVIITFVEDGNYRGTLNTTFQIVPKQHNEDHDNDKPKNEDVPEDDPEYNPGDVKILADPIPPETFDYTDHKPEPILYDGTKELVKDKDYRIVGWSDNYNAGTASVTVEFIGNYAGEKTVEFEIIPKDLGDENVAKIGVQPYTGEEVKPAPVVTDEGHTLVEGTDYDVEYKDNTEIGEGTCIVHYKGNYAQQGQKKFIIGYVIVPPVMPGSDEGFDEYRVDTKPVTPEPIGDEILIVTDTKENVISDGVHYVGDPDPHADYPDKMVTDFIEFNEETGRYDPILSVEDLIRYEGCSIRIGGKRGLRMVTSIGQDFKNRLVKEGIEVNGVVYKLDSYGTLMAWTDELAGRELTIELVSAGVARMGTAYEAAGKKDNILTRSGGREYWCNVVTSEDGTFTDEQVCDDMTLRAFVKLVGANCKTLYIYDGSVVRSIGYVAVQNADEYAAGTWQYDAIQEFIEMYKKA